MQSPEGNEAIYLQIPYNSGIRHLDQHSPPSLWNLAIGRYGQVLQGY